MTSNEICFKPTRSLIDGLDEILRFEELKSEKKREGGRLTASQEKQRNKTNKKRNYLLNDVIFPSMANVTYFLERIASEKNGILRDIFENDIEELYGLKHGVDDHTRYQPTVFLRFVRAALLDRQFLSSNFRMFLMDCMFYEINQIIFDMSRAELGPDIATHIVGRDLDRVSAWIKLFCGKVFAYEEEEHRQEEKKWSKLFADAREKKEAEYKRNKERKLIPSRIPRF